MSQIREFGRFGGAAVQAITLEGDGIAVTILSYGATIQSILVKNKDGGMTDACLGYDDVSGYMENDGYFGAAIGRHGNRIGGASFSVNGKTYQLTANERGNQLHGGFHGLHDRLWEYALDGESVTFTTRLADGEEGYPGNLDIQIRYSLEGTALRLDYFAVSDQDTVCNLTNHCYFNLNGGGSILDHTLQLESDCFTAVDDELIPTGELVDVTGTCMDFRTPRRIGDGVHDPMLAGPKGYDHNFCVKGVGLRRVAALHSELTGITMETLTTLPGVQVYSGCCISPRTGKGGQQYDQYGAICLETQVYPDSVHHADFPSAILRKGEEYRTTTVYRFSL